MYRECNYRKVKTLVPCSYNGDEGAILTWSAWKHRRVVTGEDDDGKTKVISMTIKKKEQGTKEILSKEINSEIKRACYAHFQHSTSVQSI